MSGGEEGYKLVKSFVFFLQPCQGEGMCTTEEKKLLSTGENNFEPTKKKEWQENIADNQSWKEFLEHSGPNPIKLFALLWMPQNPAIGMPSRLKKFTTSSNFTTTLCVANADFKYFFHWLISCGHQSVSIFLFWMQNDGNIYSGVNEICYAGARMRFVQSKFVRFLPSGCIRFSFHSSPILEAKKVQNSHII